MLFFIKSFSFDEKYIFSKKFFFIILNWQSKVQRTNDLTLSYYFFTKKDVIELSSEKLFDEKN